MFTDHGTIPGRPALLHQVNPRRQPSRHGPSLAAAKMINTCTDGYPASTGRAPTPRITGIRRS